MEEKKEMGKHVILRLSWKDPAGSMYMISGNSWHLQGKKKHETFAID